MALRFGRIGVIAVAVAWLVAGLVGAYVYLDRYAVYRGFPDPVLPAGVPAAQVQRVGFQSSALHRRSYYLAVLPPGYAAQAAAGRRFPVMYLLHGSPGGTRQFITVGEVAVRLAELVHSGAMPPTILVIPQGLEGLNNDTEWANTRKGRYEDYFREVLHRVDQRYATIPDRRHRAIAGMSEGGYAAVNLGLRNLRLIGNVQSWSGYYTEAPTGAYKGASPQVLRAASPSAYVHSLAPAIRRLGFRAYLFQGTGNTDPQGLVSFATALHDSGAQVDYAFFPGGHDWRLWRGRVPFLMTLAGRWFEHPEPTHPTPLVHHGRPPTAAELRQALQAEKRWRAAGGAARYRYQHRIPGQ